MKTNIQAFGHQILEIVPSNVKVTSHSDYPVDISPYLLQSPSTCLRSNDCLWKQKSVIRSPSCARLHYCRMMGKVNKLVVGVENVNTAGTGAWEASCWYSCGTVQHFYLCFRDLSNVGFDWDRSRVARVRMTGFRRNLPPFDQLTPDAVNLENGKI